MTGIDLVIDWDALAAAGVDLQTPITLELKDVMASRVLSLLMQVMSPEVELVYEATPWYVQVMTKAEANKHLVVRVYDVGDLVMEVPNFSGAPTFNLVEIVAESNARQRARGLFGDDYGAGQDRRAQREAATAEKEAREQMRGEELAQAIRETIEPGIWDGVANVRYHHGLLIVKAPAYVHGDLGLRDVQPPPAARPAEPVEVERHRGEERFTQPISGIAPSVQSVSGVR